MVTGLPVKQQPASISIPQKHTIQQTWHSIWLCILSMLI